MMDVVETKEWINGQLVQILMGAIKQRNGYLEAYHEEFVVLWCNHKNTTHYSWNQFLKLCKWKQIMWKFIVK
jgi:hypothetical protein